MLKFGAVLVSVREGEVLAGTITGHGRPSRWSTVGIVFTTPHVSSVYYAAVVLSAPSWGPKRLSPGTPDTALCQVTFCDSVVVILAVGHMHHHPVMPG